MRKFLSLIIYLVAAMSLPSLLSAQSGNLKAHTAVEPILDLQNGGLAHFFKSESMKLMDLSVHPLLQMQMNEIVEIVSLFAVNSNLDTIRVAIIDSMEPNAFFTTLSKNESIFIVNLGLFFTVKNKDELAFILGHELSHGISDLQKYIDNKFKITGSVVENTRNSYGKFLYQRPVENEVDVRSIKYLHENGFNPHAGARWLSRVQNQFERNSGFSWSHPTTQSRIDILNSAITYWRRVKGWSIKSDSYIPGNVEKLHREFMYGGPLKEFQLARAYKYLSNIKKHMNHTELDLMTYSAHPYTIVSYYAAMVFKHLEMDGLLSVEEILKLREEIFIEVITHFEAMQSKRRSAFNKLSMDLAYDSMLFNRPDISHVETYPGWSIPAVWLAEFFKVSSLEELPSKIQNIINHRSELFDESKLLLKEQLFKVSSKEYNSFVSTLNTKKYLVDSKNTLAPIKEMFTPEEIIKLITDWSQEINNNKKFEGSSNSLINLYYRLKYMDILNELAPAQAKPIIISAFKEYLSSPEGYTEESIDKIYKEFVTFLNASRFGLETFKVGFSDSTVRQLILNRFAMLLALGRHDVLSTMYAVIKDTDLRLEKQSLNNILQYILKVRSVSLREKIDISIRQSEVLVLVKHPSLYNFLRLVGAARPTHDEMVSVIKNLPYEAVKKRGTFIFSNLWRIHSNSSLLQRYEFIYKIHKTFKNNGVNFSYSLGAPDFWQTQNESIVGGKVKKRNFESINYKRISNFYDWVEKNHSNDLRTRFLIANGLNRRGEEDSRMNSLYLDTLDSYTQKYRDLGDIERTWRVFRESRDGLMGRPWVTKAVVSVFSQYLSRQNSTSLEMVWGLIQVENEYLLNKPAEIIISKKDSYLIAAAIEYLSTLDLSTVSVENLTLFLRWAFKVCSSNKSIDIVFENFWERTVNRPDLRNEFLDLTIARSLYFESNKLLLARYVAEKKFNLTKTSTQFVNNTISLPQPLAVRPLIQAYYDWLQESYPEPSALRDYLINDAMDAYLTTYEETNLLKNLKQRGGSWYKSSSLPALDIPYFMNNSFENNDERLSFIEYLVGVSDEFEERKKDEVKGSVIKRHFYNTLKIQRKKFRDANSAVRAYTVQALMSKDADSMLIDPKTSNRIQEILMGSLIDKVELFALFEAYSQSIDFGQKKVVVSHLLQSFVESSRVDGRLSASAVFDSMGAFGAKAAQAFRTTGLGGPQLQKELDHYFDHALPPSRDEIYDDLTQIFGDQLKNVRQVRQLVGSGSINYVLSVELLDSFGESKRVAVRIQKDGVVGQVQNENNIWEKAILILSQSKNPKVSRTARIVEEIRRSVMSTLDKEGVEFDLSIERRLYKHAQTAYKRKSTNSNEWEVTPVAPDLGLQKLVPQAWSKRVSIYELVNGINVNKVSDISLRKNLSKQIVLTELRAFFKYGVFDRDGHPGNWLVDMIGHKLVRLDYAQLQSVDKEFINVFQSALGIMLRDSFSFANRVRLARLLPHIYDIESKDIKLDKALVEIINDSELPSSSKPHERFFFIREKLENYSDGLVRFKAESTSALSLLARVSLFADNMGVDAFNKSLLKQLKLWDQVGIVASKLTSKIKPSFEYKQIKAGTCSSFFAN